MNVELPRTPESLLFVDYGFDVILSSVYILFIEVFAPPPAFGDYIEILKFYYVL